MPEVVNPYASPAEVNQVTQGPAAVALRRLRSPALGLLIVSSLGTAVFLVALFAAAIASIALTFSGGVTVRSEDYSGFAAFLLMGLGNILILIGSWSMRSGRRHRLCYVAGVVACIPITPFFLAIPFGIWALVVLHRRDVKEAFARI